MKKFILIASLVLSSQVLLAQDTTSAESTEVFDASQYEDGANVKKFCTQKVLNQTPTKLFGIGYESNLGFKSSNTSVAPNTPDAAHDINGMGGLRVATSILAISKNTLIISLGLNYWGAKIKSPYTPNTTSMKQVYGNRMDNVSFNALMFKPLDEKHFISVQANTDMSGIDNSKGFGASKDGITVFGTALYGWKKGDYRMSALGLARTYRLGRPLFVPVFLYNKTFNDKWGVELLLPARAHARYNFSTNSVLLAGYELEGQQFDLVGNSNFLQRGEIKPRIMFEKKLVKFFWLSAQLGYRTNGRFNIVNKYNGKESNEIIINNWGGSPYFNVSINFVSP
jgi:Domain of unknown function (DUF6268)